MLSNIGIEGSNLLTDSLVVSLVTIFGDHLRIVLCWEWVVIGGVIVLWVGELALHEGYCSNILQMTR